MKVAWTRAAQADLEEISDYIRTDNPARAASFVNEIVNSGEAIADMPYISRSCLGLSKVVSDAAISAGI